jgi:dienelactone hydrolase
LDRTVRSGFRVWQNFGKICRLHKVDTVSWRGCHAGTGKQFEMRFVAAMAHGCALILVATAAVAAQERAFSTEPFAGEELRTGKVITETDCRALPGAVWVVVEGQGECIRYYGAAGSTGPGGGGAAVVYLHDDAATTNARREVRPLASYLRATPASMQTASEGWSRDLKLPYVFLARPGTYGSSGAFAQRRTRREIDTISAALDAIKAAHGYTQLHLVGYAAGGHTAAALLAQRTDIGCTVLASPLASLGSWLAESGRTEDAAGPDRIDPIALVETIAKHAHQRIFVVTDPDDFVISARSQTLYARRLEAAGLAVRQIFAAAPDPPAHDLSRQGRAIAAECARGTANEAIAGTYQNKQPELAPDAAEPPLHTSQSMRYGVSIAEPACRTLTGVWVRVDDRGFCVRYWMSRAGGAKDEATVYIHGDIGSAKAGEAGVLGAYTSVVTAGHLQRSAHFWSRVHAAPYFAIGRLGAFGSSGNHGDRRSLTEVKVVTAALDALKAEHRIRRFHLVGQSGGGHTVAALLQMREDIGCAVMTSGSLSPKRAARDRGLRITDQMRRYYDPIEHVAAMRDRPGQRMFVLSDPQDRIVSFGSQREFVERVRGAGLPIALITATAGDEDNHGLSSTGLRLAADCARGVDDQTLITRYQGAAPIPPQ